MKIPTGLHKARSPHPFRPYSVMITLDPVLRHVLDKSVWFRTSYFDWPELPGLQAVKARLVLTERFE